jgi:D-glycero-alpha-D-manno-heptose-7-phosphate kinase
VIISQTPLRISLLGGGTDFREFFQEHGGAVLAFGLNKFVYVILKDRFDSDVYINYSVKEIVHSVDEVKHDLVREAMRKTGICQGVEITTLADVPSGGTGLGSSSSIAVGLLNAMYAHQGIQVGAERLSREACEIEIDVLGKPIGCQDQYIAGHGGLCFIEFRRGGDVSVERLAPAPEVKNQLASSLMLFFTHRTRSADGILADQKSRVSQRLKQLGFLRDLAYRGRDALQAGDPDAIGGLLHENWVLKKELSSRISDPEIDRMYEHAIAAGALGGKIAGAGGGGFLLLYVPLGRQAAVREALNGFRELPSGLSRDGSRIIFNIND